MTSNIHIYWDGPFMNEERICIRQWLSRAVLSGEFDVCQCGVTLMMVSRGHLPESFVAELACGCNEKAGSLRNPGLFRWNERLA